MGGWGQPLTAEQPTGVVAGGPLQLHSCHWPDIPARAVVSAAEPPPSRPVSKLGLAAAGLTAGVVAGGGVLITAVRWWRSSGSGSSSGGGCCGGASAGGGGVDQHGGQQCHRLGRHRRHPETIAPVVPRRSSWRPKTGSCSSGCCNIRGAQLRWRRL